MSILSAAVLAPAVPPVLRTVVATVVDARGTNPLAPSCAWRRKVRPFCPPIPCAPAAPLGNMLCRHIVKSSQGCLSCFAHFLPAAARVSISLILSTISSSGYINQLCGTLFTSLHCLCHWLSSPIPLTFTVPSGTIPQTWRHNGRSLCVCDAQIFQIMLKLRGSTTTPYC